MLQDRTNSECLPTKVDLVDNYNQDVDTTTLTSRQIVRKVSNNNLTIVNKQLLSKSIENNDFNNIVIVTSDNNCNKQQQQQHQPQHFGMKVAQHLLYQQHNNSKWITSNHEILANDNYYDKQQQQLTNARQKSSAEKQTTNDYSVVNNKKPWIVRASTGAMNTTNPIREIIETMNLAENPNKKVIPLSIGDPTIFGNLKPCKQIRDALKIAIKSGKFYGYQTASGMESARDAVASYHNKLTGNNVKRRDVILTSGCSHAIDLSICVLARRGQNILIPRPGFPLYKTLTAVYGINFKQYNLIPKKAWTVDLAHLESLIDDDTAAIIVTNPSNPCGSVYSKKHLLDIIEVAERYRKPIIADEIYDKFVFNQASSTNSSISISPNSFADNHQSNNTRDNNKSSHHNINVDNNDYNVDDNIIIDNDKRECNTSNQNGNGKTKKLTPYKDPSLIKCPNRRYRYNGDDGPEKNNGLAYLNTDLDELDDGTYFVDEDEEDDEDDLNVNVDDTDIEPIVIDKSTDASIFKAPTLNDSTNIKHQYNRSSYVDISDSPPFIAMSSLTQTVPILTCGGISKTCLIPGLRLGWIIINDVQGIFDESIRDGLGRLTQRLMGPSSLVQGALPDILNNVPDTFYAKTMQFIYKNARICFNRLSQVDGLHPHLPQGTMYLMVGFDAIAFPKINDDLDFTSKLMNEQSVLVLPGMCFDFPNYFRICLTVPTAIIEEAMTRIKEFCDKYYVQRKDLQSNKTTLSHFYSSSC